MGQVVSLEEAEILRRVKMHRLAEKKFEQLYKELPTFEDIHGEQNPGDFGPFKEDALQLFWKIYGPQVKDALTTLEIVLSVLLIFLSLFCIVNAGSVF